MITPLVGNSTKTAYYVVRQSDYTSTASISYNWKVNTSKGTFDVPQNGDSLSLFGRDSKIHVVDYNISDVNIIYSTTEIFTWKKFETKKVLFVYGEQGESHEMLVDSEASSSAKLSEGKSSDLKLSEEDGTTRINWKISFDRHVVTFDDMDIYFLGALL